MWITDVMQIACCCRFVELDPLYISPFKLQAVVISTKLMTKVCSHLSVMHGFSIMNLV
jgi:hypothetical protein